VYGAFYDESVGKWGGADLVQTNPGDADQISVSIDDAGNAIAVWVQQDGVTNLLDVWANHFVPGAGWGQNAVRIDTEDLGDVSNPRIAMGPNGNALVVWAQSDGLVNHVWAKRYTVSSGWGSSQKIEAGTGDAISPAISIGEAGSAMAVWPQLNGADNYDIWSSRFD